MSFDVKELIQTNLRFQSEKSASPLVHNSSCQTDVVPGTDTVGIKFYEKSVRVRSNDVTLALIYDGSFQHAEAMARLRDDVRFLTAALQKEKTESRRLAEKVRPGACTSHDEISKPRVSYFSKTQVEGHKIARENLLNRLREARRHPI